MNTFQQAIRPAHMLFALLFAAVFCAAPLNAAGEIAGKWYFVLQTDGGERTANADFQLEGDQVTGKWNDSSVTGTFTDGKLKLAFPIESDEAGKGTLNINAQLNGAEFTGNWEFSGYTGSLKGTRPAAAP